MIIGQNQPNLHIFVKNTLIGNTYNRCHTTHSNVTRSWN